MVVATTVALRQCWHTGTGTSLQIHSAGVVEPAVVKNYSWDLGTLRPTEAVGTAHAAFVAAPLTSWTVVAERPRTGRYHSDRNIAERLAEDTRDRCYQP